MLMASPPGYSPAAVYNQSNQLLGRPGMQGLPLTYLLRGRPQALGQGQPTSFQNMSGGMSTGMPMAATGGLNQPTQQQMMAQLLRGGGQ